MEETSENKCPYCGGEIAEDAKKCKHCGEWQEKKSSFGCLSLGLVIIAMLGLALGVLTSIPDIIHNFWKDEETILHHISSQLDILIFLIATFGAFALWALSDIMDKHK